jgi:1-acyl-sn-glycerol-3-phosphate acyltransferase
LETIQQAEPKLDSGVINMNFSKALHLFFGFVIFIPLLFISMFFVIIPCALLKGLGARSLSYRWAQINGVIFSRIIFLLLNVKIHVVGDKKPLKRMRKVCFVCNHTSIIDVPGLVGGLGIWAGFITKKELKRVPMLNLWIWAMNCVYIDRGSARAGFKALTKGVDNIKSGTPMVIFPEGTRSKDGQIHAYKSGSFHLATRSGATVIPLAIKGFRRAFEDLKGFGRIDAYIQIGEPIDTSVMSSDQLHSLPEEIERWTLEAYAKLPAGPGFRSQKTQ